MIEPRRGGLSIAALVVGPLVVVTLAGWLWWEIRREIRLVSAPSPAAQREFSGAGGSEISGSRGLDPDPSAYAVVAERPLFLQKRRPPRVVPEMEPPTLPAETPRMVPPPDWQLIGVIITEDQRSVRLWDPVDQRFLRLLEEGELDGWVAVEITPRHLVVENAGQRHVMQLRHYQ